MGERAEFKERIAEDVLEKSSLKTLDKDRVIKFIEEFLEEHEEVLRKVEEVAPSEFQRCKEYRKVLKYCRKKLREIYGVFILNKYKKREKYLEEENYEGLLKSHRSTKERVPFYKYFYKKIFSITGEPQKIMDLGCGLNPVSYKKMGCSPEYLALTFSSKDASFLKKLFNKQGIEGSVERVDLVEEIEKLEEVAKEFNPDVCLTLKLFDTLEAQKRGVTKKIVSVLKDRCEWLVVSFPKKSISGKRRIEDERRKWFQEFAGDLIEKKQSVGEEEIYFLKMSQE